MSTSLTIEQHLYRHKQIAFFRELYENINAETYPFTETCRKIGLDLSRMFDVIEKIVEVSSPMFSRRSGRARCGASSRAHAHYERARSATAPPPVDLPVRVVGRAPCLGGAVHDVAVLVVDRKVDCVLIDDPHDLGSTVGPALAIQDLFADSDEMAAYLARRGAWPGSVHQHLNHVTEGTSKLRKRHALCRVRVLKDLLAVCTRSLQRSFSNMASIVSRTRRALLLRSESLVPVERFPVRCQLVSLFAASNELPESKELEALFDRFLLRFDVGYLLVASNLRGVLVGPEPAIAATLTMDELRRAQGEVAAVKVTDDTVDALLAIRDACRGEGITESDRRWKKALGIVRASAWLAGEKKTCPEDLAILVDSLWREPKERAKVARIVGNLADPASMQSVEILDAVREIATKVAGLKDAPRGCDWSGWTPSTDRE